MNFINTDNTIDGSMEEIQKSRTGGQIALKGYSYQMLFACKCLLNDLESENSVITMEGIEDIDKIELQAGKKQFVHFQLKYSESCKDASFMKGILTNFLEVYLHDRGRLFVLVYDFHLSKGNLQAWIKGDLDKKAITYWKGVINDIQRNHREWNWADFSFDDFMQSISFQYVPKSMLEEHVYNSLQEKYQIYTDNVCLYVNALKVLCWEGMEKRLAFSREDIDSCIGLVKDNIAKGDYNPAIKWIKKIVPDVGVGDAYYEGKKPFLQDIIDEVPIRRQRYEPQILESIEKHSITVIKSSSGQGKTTLALQVISALLDKYSAYQLNWCEDKKEIDHIVSFLETKRKAGEEVLLFIDNLSFYLKEWNYLVQQLQSKGSLHIKILITARESDWFDYAGDQSNISDINLVHIRMDETEAQEIFYQLQRRDMLSENISDWRSAWNKVADTGLLIEYIYLLTHGVMLYERLYNQIKNIGNQTNGMIKCNVLRKICLADLCGIGLSVDSIIESELAETSEDIAFVLESLEKEFLVIIDQNKQYVTGIHLVRSRHLFEILHECFDKNSTALKLADMIDNDQGYNFFRSVLSFVRECEGFLKDVLNQICNHEKYFQLMNVLNGVYSYSINNYCRTNRRFFDDANDHSGLSLFSASMNPFTRFEEYDYSFEVLSDILKIAPDNENIQYLVDLKEKTPPIRLEDTDIFVACSILYTILTQVNIDNGIIWINEYINVAHWMIQFNKQFNLSSYICLDKLWCEKNKISFSSMQKLFNLFFCGNIFEYEMFVEEHLEEILHYLNCKTESLRISVAQDKKSIHVLYLSLSSEIKERNNQSVSRIYQIGRMLPHYEQYCADSVSPQLDVFENYNFPNDSHKTMPRKNVMNAFHQEFCEIWNKTVISNFECETMDEWLDYWFDARRNVCEMFESAYGLLSAALKPEAFTKIVTKYLAIHAQMIVQTGRVNKPESNRLLFTNEPQVLQDDKEKREYYNAVRNVSNQILGLVRRDDKISQLCLVNLEVAKGNLCGQQKYWNTYIQLNNYSRLAEHIDLCNREAKGLGNLQQMAQYYMHHNRSSKKVVPQVVSNWYQSLSAKQLADAKLLFGKIRLDNPNSIVFPKCDYHEGILRVFPVIVNEEELENIANSLVFLCPFSDTEYSYLTIALKDKDGRVNPYGLRIQKQFFECLREYVQTLNEDILNNIAMPFPSEITSEFIGCFDMSIELKEVRNVPEDLSYAIEMLWAYGVCMELIDKDEECDYYEETIKRYRRKIINAISKLKSLIADEMYKELSAMCKDVLNNKYVFSEQDLNNWFNRLMETPVN